MEVIRQRLSDSEDPDGVTEEILAREFDHIQNTLSLCLPGLNISDTPSKPIGVGTIPLQLLELSTLVKIREQHETEQAKKGCRAGREQYSESSTEKLSVRRQLIHEFHAVLKEQQGRAATSGVERAIRWTGSTSQMPAGNAGNAAVVSRENIRKVRYMLVLYLVSF